MGTIKQINIKNRTYYFFNDIINLKNFESNLLKIGKKSYKNIGTYNIGYITIKKSDDCKNIYCMNPLYFLINHASGYIKEENENKYLILIHWSSTLQMKAKKYLKSIQMFGMELKTKSKQ